MIRMPKFVAAIVLACGVTLAWSAPAAAHADLVSTSPSAGASLDAPPAAVQVKFDEAVELTPDSLVLRDSSERSVPIGPAHLTEAGTVVHADITQPLPAGSYEVKWRILSGDDHVESGTFGFAVKAAPSAAPAAPAVSTPPPTASAPSASQAAPATPAPQPVANAPVAAGSAAMAQPVVPRPAESVSAAPASHERGGVGLKPLAAGLIAAVGAVALAALVIRRSDVAPEGGQA